MLGNGISLIWCHFYSCLLSNWLFAEKFSNCSNSLNFEAKINCNTIKPNVPKWRKTCTELKYDLPHFYGPQSHILSGDTFEGPCSNVDNGSPHLACDYDNWPGMEGVELAGDVVCADGLDVGPVHPASAGAISQAHLVDKKWLIQWSRCEKL